MRRIRSSGIGRRAFSQIILFAVILTAAVTLVQFYLEYRTKTASIAAEIERVRQVQLPAIISALWTFDFQELHILMEGMRNFPYISYVSVRDDNGQSLATNLPKADGTMQDSDLVYSDAGRNTHLGVLSIQTDTSKIISDVVGQILASLGFEAFFLLFESFFIVILFRRLVTNHLVRTAAHLRAFSPGETNAPLALTKVYRGDELDVLADSFNEMARNLADSLKHKDRALEELRESEERNHSLVEHAPDAIMISDADTGSFIDCNRQAEELFGRRPRS